MMTPQEIFEYKMRWAPGYIVPVHSDKDWECKQWCRKNIERHKWSFDSFTDVYEHTFRFETKHDASMFRNEFTNWITEDES